MKNFKIDERLFVAGALLLFMGACSLPCLAADIQVKYSEVYLDGEIRPGDAERLAVALSQARFDVSQLTVNSMGGDVRESLRIAGLVRGTQLEVKVAKGGFCVSSCFFIFLDGFSRLAGWARADGTLPSIEQRKEFFGLVGIHRPYLKSTDGGSQAIESQEQIMKIIRSHLTLKGVPQYLIDEMMTHPSNDVYWLRMRDLEALGPYDAGVEEGLIAKCCHKRAGAMVHQNWPIEKMERVSRCSTEYWEQAFLPLQKKFIAELKSGQRPWSRK